MIPFKEHVIGKFTCVASARTDIGCYRTIKVTITDSTCYSIKYGINVNQKMLGRIQYITQITILHKVRPNLQVSYTSMTGSADTDGSINAIK